MRKKYMMLRQLANQPLQHHCYEPEAEEAGKSADVDERHKTV
jgi:hypothetical protein